MVAWIIPVVIVRFVLKCNYHSLAGCLIKASGLLRALVLCLLLNYKVSLFFLKIIEERSMQSNMEERMPFKNQSLPEWWAVPLKELVMLHSIIIKEARWKKGIIFVNGYTKMSL